jgi:predicted acylesterase/phospholipase RssA
MLAGTSTGAIVAIGLAGLHLDPVQLVEFYFGLGKEIFGKKHSLPSPSFYSTKKYEAVIKEYFPDNKLTSDLPPSPKVFAISYCLDKGEPFLFRSYPNPAAGTKLHPALLSNVYATRSGSSSVPVWQALRASSAAPPFFTQALIETTLNSESEASVHTFVDGGIGNNNPLLLAIEEARQLWPGEEIIAVTLGSGNAPMERVELPSGAVSAAQTIGIELQDLVDSFLAIADVATSSSLPAHLLDDIPYLKYIRLAPLLGESFALDEIRPEKLNMMLYRAMRHGLQALPALRRLLLPESSGPPAAAAVSSGS